MQLTVTDKYLTRQRNLLRTLTSKRLRDRLLVALGHEWHKFAKFCPPPSAPAYIDGKVTISVTRRLWDAEGYDALLCQPEARIDAQGDLGLLHSKELVVYDVHVLLFEHVYTKMPQEDMALLRAIGNVKVSTSERYIMQCWIGWGEDPDRYIRT